MTSPSWTNAKAPVPREPSWCVQWKQSLVPLKSEWDLQCYCNCQMRECVCEMVLCPMHSADLVVWQNSQAWAVGWSRAQAWCAVDLLSPCPGGPVWRMLLIWNGKLWSAGLLETLTWPSFTYPTLRGAPWAVTLLRRGTSFLSDKRKGEVILEGAVTERLKAFTRESQSCGQAQTDLNP